MSLVNLFILLFLLGVVAMSMATTTMAAALMAVITSRKEGKDGW